jgi:hypothetical protein
MFVVVLVAILKMSSVGAHFDFDKNDNFCVKLVVGREFQNETRVVVVKDQSQEIYVPEVPVYVVGVGNFQNFESKNFVVYVEGITNLRQLFGRFDPKSKYVFVSGGSQTIQEVFDLAYQHEITKLVVIRGGTIYFRSDPCDRTVTNTADCTYPKNLFSKVRIFRRCRVRVGFVTSPPFVTNLSDPLIPGIMVSMFELIARMSAFTIDYHKPDPYDHELVSNGTHHKLAWALKTRQIDVALGHLMMNDTVSTPFDFGPVVYNDNLRFTAPKPKKLKSYTKLFVVFRLELWKKIFTGIVVIIVLFYIFSLCQDFEKAALSDVVFDVFRVSIGGGVSVLPSWVSLRVLLVFYSLFSLSMDSIYLGNLSNIFAHTSYDVKVDRLEKIHGTSLKFEVNWQVERLYLLTYVLRGMPTAKDRLFIRNETQVWMLNHTALAKDNGTCIFKSLLETHPSETTLLDHFSVVTGYLSLFVTFYIRNDTHIGETVTYWGREIVERGLPVKWFEEAKRSNVRHSILPEEEDKLVVLKLAHFEESFRVLLGGYALGVVALLLEFVFLWLEKMGLVRRVQDNLVFLVGLLKPPKTTKRAG